MAFSFPAGVILITAPSKFAPPDLTAPAPRSGARCEATLQEIGVLAIQPEWPDDAFQVAIDCTQFVSSTCAVAIAVG